LAYSFQVFGILGQEKSGSPERKTMQPQSSVHKRKSVSQRATSCGNRPSKEGGTCDLIFFRPVSFGKRFHFLPRKSFTLKQKQAISDGVGWTGESKTYLVRIENVSFRYYVHIYFNVNFSKHFL
jgi:hypothetical protein